jgi:ABC-type Fe3+/spermidine/putrescine transport system ATPase subunit
MIQVIGLSKRYDGVQRVRTAVDGVRAVRHAVDEVAFEIPKGKLFTLLGPSGCGKTTTLRMLAGLERPTAGEILLDGRLVYSSSRRIFVPANKRPVGMVFQSYAIWPHMSVFDNVAFPLTVGNKKHSRAAIRERTLAVLELVGLTEMETRSATTLSGGQQQRVALARALVKEPEVLLLDEPLSNLDAQLRAKMRDGIRAIQQQLGITAVYVTHDQGEALAISDLIMLMDRGHVVEIGSPEQIYKRPRNAFTASFIGAANAIDGIVQESGGGEIVVRSPFGILHCFGDGCAAGSNVRVFLRPEHIGLSSSKRSEDAWDGHVQFSIYQGDSWDYHVSVAESEFRVRVHKDLGLVRGDRVYLEPDPAVAVVIPTSALGMESAPENRTALA